MLSNLSRGDIVLKQLPRYITVLLTWHDIASAFSHDFNSRNIEDAYYPAYDSTFERLLSPIKFNGVLRKRAQCTTGLSSRERERYWLAQSRGRGDKAPRILFNRHGDKELDHYEHRSSTYTAAIAPFRALLARRMRLSLEAGVREDNLGGCDSTGAGETPYLGVQPLIHIVPMVGRQPESYQEQLDSHRTQLQELVRGTLETTEESQSLANEFRATLVSRRQLSRATGGSVRGERILVKTD
ncbi:hypothetical protein EYR40_006085 [Pleurotus pulmonarius]|nr:hypothetical protein EYR38_003091 [Pleurotus pulmonarius]KAF4598997.1 hypothetical protein EYR40_006085 [Pleurotus pulmonarius]